jgi:hypothetical protein
MAPPHKLGQKDESWVWPPMNGDEPIENMKNSDRKKYCRGVDLGRGKRRRIERAQKMQYLLMIYDDEARWTGLSKAAQDAETQGFGVFGQENAKAIRGGNALQPTSVATTVRVRDGKTLTTDGPFAETKEQLGGYYLIEANNLDEATAIAAQIPWAHTGSIEVRPIMTFAAAQGGN